MFFACKNLVIMIKNPEGDREQIDAIVVMAIG
jgi:hypothetical protein